MTEIVFHVRIVEPLDLQPRADAARFFSARRVGVDQRLLFIPLRPLRPLL
ncbi:MAG TPA: hypothetical protein VFW31_16930 [Candidatus Angelobacter sp.]|nr:hypothetical protein [Candidatus Angelobacter sp.]